MKKGMSVNVLGLILALAVMLGIVLLITLIESGDGWVKNKQGVYIKQGNPSENPANVLAQQAAIREAQQMFEQAKSENTQFNSQCLGTTLNGYAVDIAHAPRTPEDELEQNQCTDFRIGRVNKFIELDPAGNIIRVYEP